MEKYETKLKTAKGLGSAKAGVVHWVHQRLSAVLFLLLLLYVGYRFMVLSPFDYVTVRQAVGQPLMAVPVIGLFLTGFYHMFLGLQVVIEDYVHQAFSRNLLLFLCCALALFGAVAGCYFVLELGLLGIKE